MGGGLMQLVAYGAQDIYLTGNPQITFFKVVYRRHTNFSMECIQQTINGSNKVSASATSTGTVTVSRNGDLVHKVYVTCDQNATNGVSGDKLISLVECEIGGQLIDRHYEEWLQVWAELSTPASKTDGYKYLTGGFSNTLATGGGTSQQSVMVPLQFWFCRNPGLALPLIALQYHEVKLKFTWNQGTNNARNNADSTGTTCDVWVDYIYLDTDERRRFAQVSHEYLIEQVQRQTEGTSARSYKLNFNHPVKELIWTNTSSAITTQKAKLVLNGHDRFSEQDREYFQIRQCLDHHTSVPGFNIKETEAPKLLTTPVDTGITAHHSSTPAGSNVVKVEAGKMTFKANPGAGEITSFNTTINYRVGDILLYDVGGSGADPASASVHVITKVTAAASGVAGVIFFSPNVVPPTGNDPLSVTIIARTQDPKSNCSQLEKDINVYSFALKPEEHQPSGTCNFSRIDNAKLDFSTTSVTVTNIYAINYNVLRIMSGMGGLAYSN